MTYNYLLKNHEFFLKTNKIDEKTFYKVFNFFLTNLTEHCNIRLKKKYSMKDLESLSPKEQIEFMEKTQYPSQDYNW
jgi:hypothetical protein